MSWFAEFAGKAEDMLNKLDQNAAAALNQAAAVAEARTKKSPKRGSSSSSTKIAVGDQSSFNSGGPSSSTALAPVPITSEYFNGGDSIGGNEEASKAASNGNAKNGFPFDDSDGVTVSTAKSGNGNSFGFSDSFVAVENPVPRKSSPSSGKGNKGDGGNGKPKSARQGKKDGGSSSTGKGGQSKQKDPVAAVSSVTKADDADLLDFLNDPNRKEIDEKLVLQTELANQAREVELLYKTNKQLQSENETLKSKVNNLQKENEKLAKVEEVEDQLQQSENVQKNLKRMLTEKDGEISKLKRSLDQSLDKLKQLEVLQTTQNRLELVENEKQKLMQTNEDLSNQIFVSNERIAALEDHLSSVKATVKSVENEFSSYKEKAKAILKQKDELISSLQQGVSKRGDDANDDEDANPYVSEINALKSERDLLHAEISQCRLTAESLKEETHKLESELSTVRSVNFQCQKLLQDEKSTTGTLQEENLHLRQQLSSTQFELDREKSERSKLEEWKTQKESNNSFSQGRVSPVVQNHQRNTSLGGDTEETLRMRITALTQSLLEKQGLINSLSSDKQLLQINIERMQEQLQQARSGTEYNHSEGADFPHTVISNKPLYLSESPWDSGMSTSFKRAFSTVDGFCCQAGLILRRRPNLRLGFCLYIIVLHFWVLFILFHSVNHDVPHTNSVPPRGSGPAPPPN